MAQPTAAECESARTRLPEAEEALHKLQMGALEVNVRMGEKQVGYAPASIDRLSAYVGQLKAIVARCDGCARRARRMIGVIPTN